jgi:hypothetical protein
MLFLEAIVHQEGDLLPILVFTEKILYEWWPKLLFKQKGEGFSFAQE